MLSRHEIREAAFQALFALDANPDADRETIYAAVLPADEETPAYLVELIDGTLAHEKALDAEIASKLKAGWQLSRLTKPDLIVLRLGLYEIQYEASLPDKAAINEAINLAKTYSDDAAGKFVNGILAHFIQPE